MSRITNDIELTKQRQEHIAKYGIERGFPVYMVKVMYDDIYLFFTSKYLHIQIVCITFALAIRKSESQ